MAILKNNNTLELNNHSHNAALLLHKKGRRQDHHHHHHMYHPGKVVTTERRHKVYECCGAKVNSSPGCTPNFRALQVSSTTSSSPSFPAQPAFLVADAHMPVCPTSGAAPPSGATTASPLQTHIAHPFQESKKKPLPKVPSPPFPVVGDGYVVLRTNKKSLEEKEKEEEEEEEELEKEEEKPKAQPKRTRKVSPKKAKEKETSLKPIKKEQENDQAHHNGEYYHPGRRYKNQYGHVQTCCSLLLVLCYIHTDQLLLIDTWRSQNGVAADEMNRNKDAPCAPNNVPIPIYHPIPCCSVDESYDVWNTVVIKEEEKHSAEEAQPKQIKKRRNAARPAKELKQLFDKQGGICYLCRKQLNFTNGQVSSVFYNFLFYMYSWALMISLFAVLLLADRACVLFEAAIRN